MSTLTVTLSVNYSNVRYGIPLRTTDYQISFAFPTTFVALTVSQQAATVIMTYFEVLNLRNFFRPYPLTAVATFILPVLIYQNTPPWPGNLIAGLTFLVLAVAALALERHENED